MLETLLNMSIFVKSLAKLWRRYCLFEVWLDQIYRNSYTGRLIQGLWDKIKICFRYSFLGRITEIKEEKNNMVLNESKVIRCLINSYKRFKPQVASYFNRSRTRSLLDELRKGLYFSPTKNLGIIIAVAIPTNIIFSILLKKETGILGWIIWGLLLFIGLAGLFCNVTCQDLKKTSYFVKRINNSRKF